MILRGLAISITASRPFIICATRKQANAVGQISPDVELSSISKTAALRHDL